MPGRATAANETTAAIKFLKNPMGNLFTGLWRWGFGCDFLCYSLHSDRIPNLYFCQTVPNKYDPSVDEKDHTVEEWKRKFSFFQ